jgi:hypothetical protein
VRKIVWLQSQFDFSWWVQILLEIQSRHLVPLFFCFILFTLARSSTHGFSSWLIFLGHRSPTQALGSLLVFGLLIKQRSTLAVLACVVPVGLCAKSACAPKASVQSAAALLVNFLQSTACRPSV